METRFSALRPCSAPSGRATVAGGVVVVVVGAAHCTGFFSIIFNIYTSSTINYNDTINHDELLS